MGSGHSSTSSAASGVQVLRNYMQSLQRQGFIMAEPTSIAAASGAVLIKIFGAPAVVAAVASALGFAFMWPHTKKEAFWRFFVTLLSSFFLGPLLVIGARAFMPSLFDAAKAVAVDYGTDPSFGIVFISAPLLVMSALPSW
jgi:hypothetical protein